MSYKYVEMLSLDNVVSLETPFGPGYPIVFDEKIDTEGFSEIRVWVHVSVKNYAATPVTNTTKLIVRFMHQFPGGSFDYTEGTITSDVTSYINGYLARPIIGERLRILCHPENLPPGPYRIFVTYYMV